MKCTASVLASAASRALGSIYTKFKQLRGLGFETYSTLYNSGVVPILDYCSGVWGSNKYSKIESVQNRAIRFYLGVHAFAPDIAITGDVGWLPCGVRRKIEMIRLWNRLVSMNNDRLTKLALFEDINSRGKNWSKDIKHICEIVGFEEFFHNKLPLPLDEVRRCLFDKFRNEWNATSLNIPKLRMYVKYKHSYHPEPYIYKIQDRGHCSVLAQFRCGILPLSIETGRYTDVPVDYRLCVFCQSNCVEDEEHFLFTCTQYNDIRLDLWEKVLPDHPEFNDMTICQKFETLMSESYVKYTSLFLYKAFYKRRSILYR